MSAADDRALQRTRREIVALYMLTINAVRLLLAEAYERAGRNGLLTYSEMQKYDRLTRLEVDLRQQIRRLGARVSAVTLRDLEDLYGVDYEAAKEALTTATGITFGYLLLGRDKASVLRATSGLSVAQRTIMHRDDLVWRVRQIVTRGLMRGVAQSEMVREVRKQMLVDAVRAVRWVRTEAHRVSNEARFAAGQDAIRAGGIVRKVWITQMDGKERDTHHDMNGQVRGADEYFVSPSGARAQHPGAFGILEEDANCRCEFAWITPAPITNKG